MNATPESRLAAAMARTLQLLMAALVAVVSWQVMSRYVLTSPSSWTEESARFLLIWIGTLGAAYASYTGSHIGIDLLAEHATAAQRRRLEIAINLLCAAFGALVMIYGGSRLVLLTLQLEQISPSLGIPIAWVYSIIPVSGLLIVWFCAQRLLHVATEEEAR